VNNLESTYWNKLYQSGETGWDIGYASPPIMEYFKQVYNKDLKILIPGAGNAWEAEDLWNNGFQNIYVLDYSEDAIEAFQKRLPFFPTSQILQQDFFQHHNSYDIIVEQTFFSSLQPKQRHHYAKHIHQLLKPHGKLIGLLFNHHFPFIGPPFGGTPQEYACLFKTYFRFKKFDVAYNSIKPRKHREHFLILENDTPLNSPFFNT